MKVLSIEQMKHLQELGVDTSSASLTWIHSELSLRKWNTFKEQQCVPAFTLHDMLDILPESIKWNSLIILKDSIRYSVGYGEGYDSIIEFHGNDLMDITYKMLCWVYESKS